MGLPTCVLPLATLALEFPSMSHTYNMRLARWIVVYPHLPLHFLTPVCFHY